MIEGSVQEIERYFSFAHYTNCKMMYWTNKGDLFLLYHGNRFVYFKTRTTTTHNAALSYKELTNIFHFIRAKKQRDQKSKKKKIELMKIYDDRIHTYTGDNFLGESHTMTIQFVKDSTFSDTLFFMDNLKGEHLTKNLSALKIKKSVLADYYSSLPSRLSFQKMNKTVRERDFNKVQSWQWQFQSVIKCSRERLNIWHPPIGKETEWLSIEYISDFMPLSDFTNEFFYLSDHALWLIKRLTNVKAEDFVYLYRSDQFSFVEVKTPLVKFRIVDPFIQQKLKKNLKTQKLL